MKITLKFFLMITIVFFSASVFADHAPPLWLPANKVVPHLAEKLEALKAKSTLPIMFPQKIPVSSASQKYYVSIFSESNNDQYNLNIDATPNCNGVKYCNIGSIIVRVNGEVGQHTPGSTALTQMVKLSNGQQAFFTPAHAEADFWSTMLQWKQGNLAYYFSWTINKKTWDEKNIIIQLANSALKSIPAPRNEDK